jgi:hypothetical protein
MTPNLEGLCSIQLSYRAFQRRKDKRKKVKKEGVFRITESLFKIILTALLHQSSHFNCSGLLLPPMNRLYKFFALLFCAFVVVSFIYGTLISWVTFKILMASITKGLVGTVPLSPFLRTGLIHAFLYGLVLLLMVIGLFNIALQNEQKFTVRNIIQVTVWFYVITTVVYGIYYLTLQGSFGVGAVFLISGPLSILPPLLWFPFPLAWLSLFFIMVARIKKV